MALLKEYIPDEQQFLQQQSQSQQFSNNNEHNNNNYIVVQPTIVAIPDLVPASPSLSSSTASTPMANHNNNNDNAATGLQYVPEQQQQYSSNNYEWNGEINYNNNNNGLSPSVNTTTTTNNNNAIVDFGAVRSVATISSPWQYDELSTHCYLCRTPFIPILQGKHHCRLCGYVFCHTCSQYKSLIPPTQIVLIPRGGKKAKPQPYYDPNSDDHDINDLNVEQISFTPDPDPDRMLTYISSSSASGGGGIGDDDPSNHNGNSNNNNNKEQPQLLYGKGLEERIQLARQPLRVCSTCYVQLQPLQEELRATNSNAVRFNYIDPTSSIRLFNSPIAFTLGHEIRKAAYTLNNLLPLPKRRVGALMSTPADMYHPMNSDTLHITNELQQCRENCVSISPNLSDVDGIRIPAKLLQHAKGIAVMTVVKTGFGLAGAEFGTGLVVAKLPSITTNTTTAATTNNNINSIRWSAPSAIGAAGVSWGALLGAQICDHVFVLMTDAAVELMFSENASIQLGADIGVAVGPVGRAVEGDFSVMPNQAPVPIYTYSISKGLYAGISLDGKVIATRHQVNETFYGYPVTGREILNGLVPTPPAAQPLYEALARCHVYALNNETIHHHSNSNSNRPTFAQQEMGEYGEIPEGVQYPANPPYPM